MQRILLYNIIFLNALYTFSQNIELYQQFNGRYDYLAIGNTMNLAENNTSSDCDVLTQSSAALNLTPSQTVEAAYLYWSGSGEGDFEVALNGVSISAQRDFSHTFNGTVQGQQYSLPFFAAFADVTQQVQNTGNGAYTLSDFDISQVLIDEPGYCDIGENYAGWAIYVIYEDASSLPLNQINLYDGLEGTWNSSISIELDNIQVASPQGAKVGFLAWEGDAVNFTNESVLVNGSILSGAPLNPSDNIFNGTNTFTGASTLWNMDLDVFDMDSFIQTGDISIDIDITTGNDFVMMNNVVTVVNSQLPDATVEVDDLSGDNECENRDIEVEYTVYNVNSTATLPAGTPIAFYADNTLLDTAATQNDIPIGGSESQGISLTIPASVPDTFTLRIVVNDDGTGTTVVDELNYENNEYTMEVVVGQDACHPDASVGDIGDVYPCRLRDLTVEYTVYNTAAAEAPLPAGTPVVFYAAGEWVASRLTTDAIPIDGEIRQEASFSLPESVPDTFELKIIVNDDSQGSFFIEETDYTNNEDAIITTFGTIPDLPPLDNMQKCSEGFGRATFDLWEPLAGVPGPDDELTFYLNYEDALAGENAISNPHAYSNTSRPQRIYVRLENQVCFTISDFELDVEDCPPHIPQGFSPNGDGINDEFEIPGLLDVFPDHEIRIYSRYGNLIFIGDNDTRHWDGRANHGILDGNIAPTGMYYYVLDLRNTDYNVYTGMVYLNR